MFQVSVLLIKPVAFFPFSLVSPYVLLKLLTIIHSLLPYTHLQINAFIDAEKYFSDIHWHERLREINDNEISQELLNSN